MQIRAKSRPEKTREKTPGLFVIAPDGLGEEVPLGPGLELELDTVLAYCALMISAACSAKP
jgi:hypothetical protein